jgi:8-oxo-dGTP diphosphatase
VPLSQLQLLEGQDMTLASVDEILHGRIWSRRLNQERQLAPALTLLTERLHELNQAD